MAELTSKESLPDCIFGKAGSNKGKSDGAMSAGTSPQNPPCPQCGSTNLYRDGLRYLADGSSIQRWLCRTCAYRFSEKPSQKNPKWSINTQTALVSNCQICAKGAKNLRVPTRKHVGAGVLTAETKASIAVFEGWLKKEGYSESRYPSNLRTLVYLGADLMNPEDVKTKLGNHPIKDGAKCQYVYAYDAFAKMMCIKWDPPHYKQEESIPFIPDESELDQLITAARSRRMAAYLQVLKETYADPGEALRIEWSEISSISIKINHPVKGHLPREIEVTNKVLAMLNCLPRTSERVFSCKYAIMEDAYLKLRKRLTELTKNERFMYIELRSFRHWGGTMIAQVSNGNVLLVKKLLGHKRIENSMKYINMFMLSFKNTEYEVAAATTVEETKQLLAAGFDYICEKNGIMLFRRPKRFSPAASPFHKRESDLVNLK